MTKQPDDGCAEIGRETLRKWCKKNGVVLDPIIAADLVAYIASAVRTDRAVPTRNVEQEANLETSCVEGTTCLNAECARLGCALQRHS